MRTIPWKKLLWSLLFVLPVILSACGNVYNRDDFKTAVMGKSESEVTQQFGKPDAVDATNPAQVKWIYTHKTFDLANHNTVDSKTTVIFERAGNSTPHVANVEFG